MGELETLEVDDCLGSLRERRSVELDLESLLDRRLAFLGNMFGRNQGRMTFAFQHILFQKSKTL